MYGPKLTEVLDFGKGLRHLWPREVHSFEDTACQSYNGCANAREHRANTCPEESRKLDYRDVLAESEDKQFSKEEMKRYTLCRGNGRVEVWGGGQKPCFP